MKVVFISDTHGKHRRLQLPPADMIIHAGDVTFEGADHQAEDFLRWFSGLPFKHKIFIAGNHDFYFEDLTAKQLAKTIPTSIVYLNNSGIVLEGLHIWGSPVTPWFFDWAFNQHRGAPIAKYWKQIPSNTDLLITHGPPAGILDTTGGGHHVGCEELLKRVKRIKPKVHVFGHIHEAYGKVQQDGTIFINASVVDSNFYLMNAPVLYDF